MGENIIIDCISDLHGFFPELEGGDLLIVAGDLTTRHTIQEYFVFKNWFQKQSYKKKVLIAGNHDTFLEGNESRFTPDSWFSYLEDSGTEFEGLKIWGSPWTKTFEGMNPDCKSFTLDTEEELEEKFVLIPDDIDILITHSPPYGILDAVESGKLLRDVNIYLWTEHTGSEYLREVMFRIKPKLMVFGHIHEWGGKMIDLVTTKCVNASHVNENYQPVNKPIRIEL